MSKDGASCPINSMQSNPTWRKYCRARNLNPLLALALIVLSGCGSYPGVMAGNWLITLTPSVSLDQVLATTTLKQSGTQISGTVAFRGVSTSCNADASVSGTLQGNTLDIVFVQSQSIAELTGTINMAFTSGSGAYATGGNSCLQALGPGAWSAVFIGN